MVKAALIQTIDYSSNQEGIEKVSKTLKNLGRVEADIVCLPEQWLKNNTIVDYEKEFFILKNIAKEYSMTVILGAFYEKTGRSFEISSRIIGPNGDFVGKQEKIHPFGYEKKVIKSGRHAKVFKTQCRFSIAICYDMVFPDVSNKFVKKGAEIIFSPSRIVKLGIYPWQVYLQSRSLENRVPVIAANVHNRRFGGNSTIVDLCEKDDIMIPKLQVCKKGQKGASKNFNFSKYLKSRKSRFAD